jgi:hypothetical protein
VKTIMKQNAKKKIINDETERTNPKKSLEWTLVKQINRLMIKIKRLI